MTVAFPPPTISEARFAKPPAWHPLWIAFGLTALATALRLSGTVDSDVAWQLWIAGRLHAGANLYRDIIETNPPLWFWMAVPIDRLAVVLQLRVEAVLAIVIGLVSATSLAATNRLIRHVPAMRRALLLAVGALALTVIPWVHLGQREQLVLIGTVPYCALIAARRSGDAVPPWLALLVGAGAAAGFALKHYFLAVPILLELWLVVGLGRRWQPFRSETRAIAAAGLVYAAALLLFEQDFLTAIVPLVRLAYGDFGAPAIKYMFGPFAVASLAALVAVAAHTRLLWGGHAPFAAALFVAGIGFAAIYFIQFKGWPYHAIPMIGCGCLALAALLTESETPPRAAFLTAPALLALPLVLAFEEQRHPALPSPDLRQAIAGLKPGNAVGFLATETAIPWSVTLQGGYTYASRYNGFWMMHAILRNERRGSPDQRLTDLGRRIVTETIADFTCTPPRRIIVSRPRPGEDSFDILPFFLRAPGFGALLSHYRATSRTSVEVYELSVPLPSPPRGCRRVGL